MGLIDKHPETAQRLLAFLDERASTGAGSPNPAASIEALDFDRRPHEYAIHFGEGIVSYEDALTMLIELADAGKVSPVEQLCCVECKRPVRFEKQGAYFLDSDELPFEEGSDIPLTARINEVTADGDYVGRGARTQGEDVYQMAVCDNRYSDHAFVSPAPDGWSWNRTLKDNQLSSYAKEQEVDEFAKPSGQFVYELTEKGRRDLAQYRRLDSARKGSAEMAEADAALAHLASGSTDDPEQLLWAIKIALQQRTSPMSGYHADMSKPQTLVDDAYQGGRTYFTSSDGEVLKAVKSGGEVGGKTHEPYQREDGAVVAFMQGPEGDVVEYVAEGANVCTPLATAEQHAALRQYVRAQRLQFPEQARKLPQSLFTRFSDSPIGRAWGL